MSVSAADTPREPLAALAARADRVRRAWVGEAVHLRALVEISSHCRRACAYCGLRAPLVQARFRLAPERVLACAREARDLGLGTVVIQAGEDPALTEAGVADLVTRIRGETGLVVTLSLGERPRSTLAAWRRAGAERYLMRFETSDEILYQRLHPDAPAGLAGRLEQLRWLDELGYQVGTGFLVGLPGQDAQRLEEDIALLARLRPHMIGIGPYVSHPDTPLGHAHGAGAGAGSATVLACLARLRLACPWAQIPVTSAFRVAAGDSAVLEALRVGASVIMPDFTPPPERGDYRIYPGKGADPADPADQVAHLARLVCRAGRVLGTGPGSPVRPPESLGGLHA